MNTAAAQFYVSLDVFKLEECIRDTAADLVLYGAAPHTRRRLAGLAADVTRRCGEDGTDDDAERYARRHLRPLIERLTAYVATLPASE